MTNNIERLVVGIRHRAKNGNMQIEVFSFVTDFKTKDAITACEIIIKVILSLKTFLSIRSLITIIHTTYINLKKMLKLFCLMKRLVITR